MSDNLQQLAEQLARKMQCRECGETCPKFMERILAALQSAARQGQREALELAAKDAEFEEEYCGRYWVEWLRARASTLEGGTEQPPKP